MGFKKNILFLSFLFVAVLFLGIGYAKINNTTLTISGLGTAADNGTVRITNVVKTASTSNVTATTPTWTDTTVSFSVSFTLKNNDSSAQNEHSATYRVTITNDSIYSYVFGSDVFNPHLDIRPPSGETLEYSYDVDGIRMGDPIPAKQSVTFTVKLTLYPSGGKGTYSAGVSSDIEPEESTEGVLTGAFKGSTTGDLEHNNLVKFTITVLNSYQREKTFNIVTTNNNFQIVDANGNSLPTFQIAGNTEGQDIDFYVKVKDGVRFPNDLQKINVYLEPTDEDRIPVGTLSLSVYADPTLTDDVSPTINNFTVTKGNTQRTLTFNWDASDNIGVDHYEIYVYNSSNQVVAQNTNTTATQFVASNLQNGSYRARLVVYDGTGNYSTRDISSQSYTWTYTVTINCTNCSANPNGGSVEAGATYRTTFSGANDKNAPSNMSSVIMYDSTTGNEIPDTNGLYTYSDSVLEIPNVKGNITITASGRSNGCLVEGTKVLLANGKTKNIEDIDYDDLLSVWNYDTGKITYEYPLWMEKEEKIDEYTEITFSDNSKLKIAINHSLYSTYSNRFIDLTDPEFRIGTGIAKVSNEGKFSTVKIKKIEKKYENVRYYFVGSTTYYNIIADNILTTDQYTMISNLYGFENGAIWPKEKQIIVNNPKNIVDYSYFKDVLPYYLYKGFRAGEVGHLINNNVISLNQFKYYITSLVMSTEYIKNPIMKNNKNLWMVTTSENNISSYNKNLYLREESSIYILPKSRRLDFKGWLNTSDNKIYYPGDKYVVSHGTHFIGLYY